MLRNVEITASCVLILDGTNHKKVAPAENTISCGFRFRIEPIATAKIYEKIFVMQVLRIDVWCLRCETQPICGAAAVHADSELSQ